MKVSQEEFEGIKNLPAPPRGPIRVTYGTGTPVHILVSLIAKNEGVHPNAVIRAMVKTALVEWLKQASKYTEFTQLGREFLDDERL